MTNGVSPPLRRSNGRRPRPPMPASRPIIEARLDKLIAEKRVWELHGVIVARGRRIVLERYFEARGPGLGQAARPRELRPETLHDVRSVTKSIVALIYGIALAEKKVPPPGEPLFAQFPEYADVFAADERRKRLTIAHALTMTLGTEWSENASLRQPGEQRDRHGDGAGSLSLHPGAADHRAAGQALHLQRRCDRAARAHHREGHRQIAPRLCARRAVRSDRARARPNGSPARTPGSAAATASRPRRPACA